MSITLDPSMQLSKYFTLGDLTTTTHNVDNTPDVQSLANLQKLAALLDQIYDTIGPFTVTSAYRSPALNALIGGASSSQHMRGMAADLRPDNTDPYSYFLDLLRSPLFASIGQLINEADAEGIVHVSTPTSTLLSQALYLENGSYLYYTPAQVAALQEGANTVDTTGDTVSESGVVEEVPTLTPATAIILGAAVFLVITTFVHSTREQS